jgi:hypothetical protein
MFGAAAPAAIKAAVLALTKLSASQGHKAMRIDDMRPSSSPALRGKAHYYALAINKNPLKIKNKISRRSERHSPNCQIANLTLTLATPSTASPKSNSNQGNSDDPIYS